MPIDDDDAIDRGSKEFVKTFVRARPLLATRTRSRVLRAEPCPRSMDACALVRGREAQHEDGLLARDRWDCAGPDRVRQGSRTRRAKRHERDIPRLGFPAPRSWECLWAGTLYQIILILPSVVIVVHIVQAKKKFFSAIGATESGFQLQATEKRKTRH